MTRICDLFNSLLFDNPLVRYRRTRERGLVRLGLVVIILTVYCAFKRYAVYSRCLEFIAIQPERYRADWTWILLVEGLFSRQTSRDFEFNSRILFAMDWAAPAEALFLLLQISLIVGVFVSLQVPRRRFSKLRKRLVRRRVSDEARSLPVTPAQFWIAFIDYRFLLASAAALAGLLTFLIPGRNIISFTDLKSDMIPVIPALHMNLYMILLGFNVWVILFSLRTAMQWLYYFGIPFQGIRRVLPRFVIYGALAAGLILFLVTESRSVPEYSMSALILIEEAFLVLLALTIRIKARMMQKSFEERWGFARG